MSTRNLFGVVASLCFVTSAFAQTSVMAIPQVRLTQTVDEANSVTLSGNVHPLMRAATAAGTSQAVDPSLPMERMILHLKSDATQDATLAQLIASQNDPNSPLFHHYLTPQDYGSQFGVAAADIAKVTAWLTSHGFKIDEVPAGNRSIIFSGTAAQVNSAFKAEMRSFNVAGVAHVANASDPQIPVALANVVGGVVQLHDFQAGHSATKLTPIPAALAAHPEYNTSTGHFLSPADFSTIYDLNSLYSSGVNGTGQSIAVVSRSNIAISDIETFRNSFGLPANDPQVLIVDIDPGFRYDGNSVEATLDTEWAGAVAPKATIKVVAGRCTNTSDGVTSAEIYAVNNNVAPIISVSYGLCEAAMGSSGVAFQSALWQQAAAQGQTVVVSSGDSGAAGCNSPGDLSGTQLGVNGLCTSPYATCVGGTEFVEGSNPGQYWLAGNSASGGSAISYIPETVWNESGANGGSGDVGGGGGASIIFAKPSWQTGVGVPSDGRRDVPDLSLSAAEHDGYVIYESWAGGLFSAGGTSFSTPAFAGMMALVNQKIGYPQGLANPTLYALAAKQASGGAAVFHDITTGNNSVPGLTGFSATPGYDLATGLGTVDAAMLVNHWADAAPSLSLISSAGVMNVNAGQTTQVTITSNASALNSAVQFTVTGAPSGVTVTFTPATIASPGSGATIMKVATTVTAKQGNFTLLVTAKGGSQTATLGLPLTVGAPTFLLVPAKTNIMMNLPASSTTAITTTAQTGFSAALTLSVSGAPSGVTATLSSKSIAAPGTGSVNLGLATATSATPGTYMLTITAQGGGQTQTATIYLVIPSFVVSAPSGYYKGNSGGTVTIPVTITPQPGFGSSISLFNVANYLPPTVTTSFSPSTVSGSATSNSTMTLNLAKSLPNGAYPFFIGATGGNVTQSAYEWLLVGINGSCTLAVYNSSYSGNVMNVTAGQSVTGEEICLWPQGTFSAPLTVSFSGIPSGMTVQPAKSLLGDGNPVNLLITTAQSLAGGTYNMTINSLTSDGFAQTYPFSVVVAADNFGLTATQGTLTVNQGGSAPLSLTSAHTGVFNSAVNLSASGLPNGVTASFAKSTMAAPGDGTTVVTFTASASAVAGTYSVSVTGTGGGATHSLPLTLTIVPPSCTLGVSYASGTTSLSLAAGQTGSVSVSCTSVQGTFSAPLALSLSGAPSGVTAQTLTPTMTAGGTTSVQVSSPVSLAATSFSLSLTATSGGFTKTVPVSVTISDSDLAFAAAQNALTITVGNTAQLSVTATHKGAFSSAMSLAWSGLPTGVTASLSKSSFAAPGDGTAVTTFNVPSTVTPGNYTATLTASGGGITRTAPVTLTIAPPPSCTLATTYPSGSPLSLTVGQSGSVQVACSGVQGVFSAPLTLSLTGAPSGVTASPTASTMTAGGSVAVNINITTSFAASTSITNFNLTLKATSGTFTQTIPVAVSVAPSYFNLTTTASSLTFKAGATGSNSISTHYLGNFHYDINETWSGVPAGVTISKATSVSGDAFVDATTFSAASTVKAGTYTVTLNATGGGLTQSLPITLIITSK